MGLINGPRKVKLVVQGVLGPDGLDMVALGVQVGHFFRPAALGPYRYGDYRDPLATR